MTCALFFVLLQGQCCRCAEQARLISSHRVIDSASTCSSLPTHENADKRSSSSSSDFEGRIFEKGASGVDISSHPQVHIRSHHGSPSRAPTSSGEPSTPSRSCVVEVFAGHRNARCGDFRINAHFNAAQDKTTAQLTKCSGLDLFRLLVFLSFGIHFLFVDVWCRLVLVWLWS